MNDNVAGSGAVGKAGRARRILLCLDRSTRGEYSIPYAVAITKALDGLLTVVSVLQPRTEGASASTSDAIGWEISRQAAQTYLERVQGDLAQALAKPVELRLEQGNPSERILDVMRETEAYITILGSGGEGEASPLSLGSNVQKVVTGARSSLFVVHPSSSPVAPFEPHRILVPLDGSIRAESVLPTAARLAKFVKGELLLVNVIQEPACSEILQEAGDLKASRDLAQRLEEASARYLERLRGQLAREGVSVQTLVIRHSNEHESLLAIARPDRSDLVILSAHGSAMDSRRAVGSTTMCILSHSTVPLLVLQDLPEQALEPAAVTDGKQSPPLRGAYSSETA